MWPLPSCWKADINYIFSEMYNFNGDKYQRGLRTIRAWDLVQLGGQEGFHEETLAN